jgi:ElaB/YqjD/DUF883 family membrane-anchored ribosome-binding protein
VRSSGSGVFQAALNEARHQSADQVDVTDAVEDGVRMALKTIKQVRHVAEDVIREARHTTKEKPFQALSIVFAIGVAAGRFLA